MEDEEFLKKIKNKKLGKRREEDIEGKKEKNNSRGEDVVKD